MSVPPVDEQRRISDFLDDRVALLDRAVELRRQQGGLLQERFAAQLEAEVTHAEGESAPWVKAGHVLTVQPGYAFSSEEFDPSVGPRLLRGVNVGVGTMDWRETVRWGKATPDIEQRFTLHCGDVVMGMDRPWISTGFRLARVTQSDLPALLLQRVARLIPGDKIDRAYMYWAFHSVRFRLSVEADLTGLGVPHLSGEQVAAFRLRLPTLTTQPGSTVEIGRFGLS